MVPQVAFLFNLHSADNMGSSDFVRFRPSFFLSYIGQFLSKLWYWQLMSFWSGWLRSIQRPQLCAFALELFLQPSSSWKALGRSTGEDSANFSFSQPAAGRIRAGAKGGPYYPCTRGRGEICRRKVRKWQGTWQNGGICQRQEARGSFVEENNSRTYCKSSEQDF